MNPRSVGVALLAVSFVVACSSDESSTPATTVPATPTVSAAAPPSVTTVPSSVGSSATSQPTGTSAPATEPTAPGSATAPSVVDVPEVGIPGLDSDDAFCAAWSRFGGTWQVLLVGSTFLDDPARVAGWEVASAVVVERAFEQLVEHFPDELAAEAASAVDGYFGVLARRSADARDALIAAGADAEQADALAEAWIAALAGRDPTTPDVAFEAPPGLGDLLDRAAGELTVRRVEFHLDPSMDVTVETPLTDAYLETSCPDQGTLAGGEVGG